MNRKKFLKTTGILTVGTLLGGLYSWQIEPKWLEFTKVSMPVKNLPNQLIGKVLMQISDIHVGNRFDYQFIIDSFKKAQELQPDFVVYTGDFVSWENSEQLRQLTTVLKYAVKGSLGTAAVLGNHDYGKNWKEKNVADSIVAEIERASIQVLRNECIKLGGLNIIGMDDFWGMNFNPQKAISHYDESLANILLCHNPDVCDEDVWGDYKGWILSGHTHGGQVKPPFLPPPVLPVKNKMYTSGIFDVGGGRTLYINRALGTLHQVRFNVRPEITLFELKQA